MTATQLLGDLSTAGGGAEPLVVHAARLGPPGLTGVELVDALARSGLRGRGGALFPTAVKWRAVAERSRGDGVVLANGAEGEPLSMKDRLLMRRRPHLVVDGATLAAEAVGASDVVLYVGDQRSRAALAQALRERRERVRLHLLEAPARYVAGEESAAVHSVDEGVALPTTTPPRPFERGGAGRPTLVQNVETLAHAALVARHGGVTGCEAGRGASQGTVLLSVSGAVPARTVVEVAEGTTVGEAVTAAGGVVAAPGAVLLGGYFGTWRDAEAAWSLALDAAAPREFGGTLGCGVVAVLEGSRCGLAVTARIAAYLAGESAGQCGPCVFGLRAIAEALGRLAACAAAEDDVARLCRWVGELPGRGACRHPDGAAAMVRSALATFAADLVAHVEHRRCAVGPRVPCPA